MKVYRGSRGIAPLIRDLGARRRLVANLTHGRFTPWKEPQYSLNRRLGRPQSRSGRFEYEKNHFFLPGCEPRLVQPLAWSLYGPHTSGGRKYKHLIPESLKFKKFNSK
jgi:hypothetical protein